jgi:hypothetical protein
LTIPLSLRSGARWIFDCDPFDGRKLLARAVEDGGGGGAEASAATLRRTRFGEAAVEGVAKLRFDLNERASRTRAVAGEAELLRKTMATARRWGAGESWGGGGGSSDDGDLDGLTSLAPEAGNTPPWARVVDCCLSKNGDGCAEIEGRRRDAWHSGGHTSYGSSEGRRSEGRRARPTVWTAAFVWPAPASITSQPEWPGVPVGVVEVHEAIVVVDAIEGEFFYVPLHFTRILLTI